MSRNSPQSHQGQFPRITLWAFCLCGALFFGCGPTTAVQKAGLDQDIARDINWELRKHRPRLDDVTAYCVEGVVTLQGRVDSKKVESEALEVASVHSRGCLVVSKLDVRPR